MPEMRQMEMADFIPAPNGSASQRNHLLPAAGESIPRRQEVSASKGCRLLTETLYVHHFVKTWHHPQKPKVHVTVVRKRSSHAIRPKPPLVTCIGNSDVVWYVTRKTHRHTHTYTLISILCPFT